MRKEMLGFLVILGCGALLAGGCAKKEIVKSEEPVQVTKPAETMPEKPAPAPEQVKEQPVKEPVQSVSQEPLKEVAEVKPEMAFEKVYFDFDSYILSQPARDILSKNADLLKNKDASLKIQIEGNCDERGSDEYNLALGEKRAKAAFNYLVTLGVPAERLSVISYGKEKPVDPGHDEAAWAKNRRDEFVVVK
jgi:peptidoglycan-associated lipoprotein